MKIKDYHVIGAMLLMTVIALSAGCGPEDVERMRGNNVRLCLKDYTVQECLMLFPPGVVYE